MALPPVYSELFLGESLVGPVAVTRTVDAGYVFVLRDIDCYGSSGSGGHALDVTLTSVDSVLYCIPLVCNPTADGQIFQWRGRQVCEPGTIVTINASAGTWLIGISGYILTLP